MSLNGVCIRSVFERKIGPYKVCIFVNIAGCPQSTEKVLGVGILAFSQIRSEKGIPFGVKEEFSSLLNGLRLLKVKLAVSPT